MQPSDRYLSTTISYPHLHTLHTKALGPSSRAEQRCGWVFYSRLNLVTNTMGFVQMFFLTTRSVFTIPRNSFQVLYSFYLPNTSLQGYTECLVLFEGESTSRMVRIEDNKVDTKNSTLICNTLSPI